MRIKNKSKLKENASELRLNMTPEERHLWYDFLSSLPITVNRQKRIGDYIVDFYIASFNIVIELDGSQHYTTEMIERDKKRDEWLTQKGITVLRYRNIHINQNFHGVCSDILAHINVAHR